MPVLNWKELQNLVNQKQTGEIDMEQPWLEGWDPNAANAQEEYDRRFLQNSIANSAINQNIVNANLFERTTNPQNYTSEANALGYGDYRKDDSIPYQVFRENPNEARAQRQTAAAKLANGIIKSIPYAATTYLDNTVGLLAALENEVEDAANGDGDFDFWNSWINTGFANAMQDIREWADDFLPNYRTQEELDDSERWWKHLNANFWGDVFIKNLGFTVGAGASAKTLSRIPAAIQGKAVRNAYKAALAAKGGEREAVQAFQRVLQGEAMNTEKLFDTFEQARKAYRRIGLERQLIGTLGGAIGESRVEALNAAKEARESMMMDAQNTFDAKHQALVDEVMENFKGREKVYDEFGYELGEKDGITQAGKDYYNARLQELQNEYMGARDVIDAEAERVAKRVYGFNMPVLWGSDMIMFGRMLSGGFKTQAKNHVKRVAGQYVGKGNKFTAELGNIAKASTEGVEELTQKIISEGAKNIADYEIGSFYNGQYDKDSIRGLAQVISNMVTETAPDVLGQASSWEEFAIGMLTGAISNRILGSASQNFEQVKANQAAAEEMNKRLADPEFSRLWTGMVRHNQKESNKNLALNEEITDDSGNVIRRGNEFAWHNEDDAQLFGDVKMFADAGRIKDLEDMVDSVARIKLEDVASIRKDLIDEDDPEFQKKSDAQVLDWLNKRAKKVKDTIDQYRDFRDAVDVLSLGTTDPDVIDEMVFTKAQMQNFENRYNSILDEVLSLVKPKLEAASEETDAAGNPTKNAKKAQAYLASESKLRRLFGGVAMDISGRDKSSLGNVEYKPAEVDDSYQADVLKTLEDLGVFAEDSKNPDIKQKVEDLQKLVRSRQAFYTRLFDPRFREKFEENKVTPDEVADDIEEDMADAKVKEYLEKLRGARNLAEYVNIQNSGLAEEKDPNIVDKVYEGIDNDPVLKAYEDRVGQVKGLKSDLQNLLSERMEEETDGDRYSDLDLINTLLDGVDADAIMTTLPEDSEHYIALAQQWVNSIPNNRKRARRIAKMLVTESLRDKAQGKGFGIIDADFEEDRLPYLTWTNKKTGEQRSNEFVISVDDDGYTKVKVDGPRIASGLDHAGLNALGVTDDDLGRSDWKAEGKENEFDEILDGTDNIRIEKVTLRPDGTMALELSLGDETMLLDDGTSLTSMSIKQGNPKKVLAAISPELSKRLGMDTQVNAAYKSLENRILLSKAEDDPELLRISRGEFEDSENLTDQEKFDLIALASGKIVNLKAQSGKIVTSISENGSNRNDDEKGIDDSDPRRIRQKQELREMEKRSVLGTPFSVYDINEAKQGRSKKYVAKTGDESDERTNYTISWLLAHNSQTFIDSGALAKIAESYAKKNKGKQLPIYFIANPHFIANNYEANPFVSPNTKLDSKKSKTAIETVLAVEIDDDARKVLSGFKGENFRESDLIEIDGKQYQVIGQVYNPPPSRIERTEKRDKEYADILRTQKENANKIWDHAIGESIKPQYEADVKANGAESFGKEGKWYVAKVHPVVDVQGTQEREPDLSTGERLYTTLNYIMPGRNETRKVGSTDYEDIPIKQALKRYLDNGGPVHFMIKTRKGSVKTGGAPNMSPGIDAPIGSLWMATKNPNGAWSWSYVTVQTADNFDFEANSDSPLVKKMDKALDRLFEVTNPNATSAERKEDFRRRRAACEALESIFYLGHGNSIRFDYNGGNPIVFVGGYACNNREDFISHVKTARYAFTVNADRLTDLNDLMDAGILTTEMRSFVRMGASFGINPLEDTDADNNPVTPRPRSSNYSLSHTSNVLNIWWSERNGVKNIRLGDNGYRLTDDGRVMKMTAANREEEEVLEPDTVRYVKALSLALEQKELMKANRPSPEKFPGKIWEIKNDVQHTFMFETEVDDEVVHMVMRGKDSAVYIELNDEEWNLLMSAGDIHEYNGETKPEKVEEGPKSNEPVAPESEPEPEPEPKPAPKRRRGMGMRRNLDDIPDDAPTPSGKKKEDAERNAEDNCGKV